jgi:AraC-like DNA-binding protein
VLFFATLLLTSKRYQSRPNRYLAASLITLSLLMLRMNEALENSVFTEIFNLLRIEYLFSVFLYMYMRAILNEKISKTTFFWLFSPFVVLSTLHTATVIFGESVFSFVEVFLESFESLEAYIIILFNAFVVSAAIVKIYQSSLESSVKKWLYLISGGLMTVMLFFLALEFAELLFDVDFWDSFGIVMTVFFVSTSYVGIQRLQIHREQEAIQKIYSNPKKTIASDKKSVTLTHFEHMQLLMQNEELYRDASLDREIFAKKLGLSASSVTRILKEEGQVSFKEFINQYRIQLAKEMLTDTCFDIFSLEAIGKEVGFKSRSTFYETFKKEIGVSPGTFKSNNTKKNV